MTMVLAAFAASRSRVARQPPSIRWQIRGSSVQEEPARGPARAELFQQPAPKRRKRWRSKAHAPKTDASRRI